MPTPRIRPVALVADELDDGLQVCLLDAEGRVLLAAGAPSHAAWQPGQHVHDFNHIALGDAEHCPVCRAIRGGRACVATAADGAGISTFPVNDGDTVRWLQLRRDPLHPARRSDRLAPALADINQVLDEAQVLRRLAHWAARLVGAGSSAAGRRLGDQILYTERLQAGEWSPWAHREPPPPGLPAATTGAELTLPVAGPDGRLLAVLRLGPKAAGGDYDAADGALLRDLAGAAAVALENARMIGELKHADGQVRESEARYRALFEAVQGALLICDPRSLRIEAANRAAESLYGYTRVQLQGMDLAALSDGEGQGESLGQALAGAGSGVLRLSQRTHGGEALCVEARVGRLQLEAGERWLVSLKDLTATLRAEAALDVSQQRYRELVDSLGEVVFQVDAEQRWSFLNPAWEWMSGQPAAEALGQPAVDALVEEDRELLLAALADLARGECARVRLEVRCRRRGGAARWAAVSAQPMPGPDGEYLGAFGVISDISERKRSESALRLAAESVAGEVGPAFFGSLVRYLAAALEVDFAFVGELDERQSVRTLAVWGEGREHPNFDYDLEGTACVHAITAGECIHPRGAKHRFPTDQLLETLGIEGYAAVPLLAAEGREIGILAVMTRQPMESPNTVASVLRIFALRAAAELERSWGQRDLRGRDAILNAISFSTAHLLGADTEGDSKAFHSVLARLAQAAGASRAYLFSQHRDAQGSVRVRQNYFWAERDLPDPASAVDLHDLDLVAAGFERWIYVLGRGQAICGTVSELPGNERPLYERQGVLAVLVVPVFVDGQWWGFMGLDDCRAARRWSEPEIQAAHVAADALGAAVARGEAQARLRMAGHVFENTSEGVVITDVEGRIVAVNDAFTRITGYTEAEVLGRNPSLLQSGRQDADFYELMWQGINRHGQWQGEIWNRRKDGGVYPEWLSISTVRDEAGAVTHRVGVFSDVSAVKESQQQLDFLAHHDALTLLPNRVLFQLRLEHAIQVADRHQRRVAVLFVDLDRFKQVNDTLGHAVGDEMLKCVSRRMAATLRDQDTLARLGGDEFVLVLEDAATNGAVVAVADKLLATLERPVQVGDHTLYTGGSIGIAIYPDDGGSVDTLVRNADTAMYRAKERGRGDYQFYSPEMTDAVLARLHLESRLRAAVAGEQLRLHYQPQIELQSGRVVGVEALLRWQDPERGMVQPEQFLPAAEDSRLMVPITRWVLRRACEQLVQWQAQGHTEMRVAVNVSGSLVQSGNLLEEVRQALETSGLAPDRLELEITEDLILGQGDAALEALQRLRALGVNLAIDDFGTGYSSLGYLKRLPIQAVKIDRSFIDDLPGDQDDAAIARTVIALADNLQLRVVAEGVETREQLEFLLQEGCHRVQGHWYSPPLPPESLAAWLEERGD